MGYCTRFDGVLKFNRELTGSELAILNEILEADFRDLSEEVQNAITEGLSEEDMPYYYFDLEITKDFTGLQWDGAEKTYGMVGCVNAVIQWMRKQCPTTKDFSLTGSLHAQGEEVGDVWDLVMQDGVAKRVEYVPPGEKIECPHCGEKFYYELESKSDKSENASSKTFCVTGTLSVSRSKIQEQIEDAGHKFVKTLSPKVDYLVVGEKSGSKFQKARNMDGVQVIDEHALNDILEAGD